ncbi:UDP-GalNAc:beta-1,3-N-acetylgalactosaminyltransferase 2-like isoform X2 [Neocloeon triangulifer]|uniref:UDP-GalNAc:beta-1, 3-N-acetylgalactosaminyltransferase 2-like isoform X2 n=1 Tax=Neocloeon triangulifer TaxID=2078957 RepID=UPI00286F1287|nr:UDP-GalNAc:beta-1,3-N-acetylgalactosaminyltransferase 2-like isoform X2 [Neocloeon triangulifer]
MEMQPIISYFVCVLSILFIRFIIFRPENELEDHNHLFLIGIMSRRENLKMRDSIRNTWVRSLNSSIGKHKFLIGKEFCPVPPVDRTSEFTCEEWTPKIAKSLSRKDASYEIESSKIIFNSSQTMVKDLNFQVHYDIVIKRLCLLSEIIKSHARLSLINLSTNERVFTASFSSELVNEKKELSTCKQVEPFVFPKGFEGKIVLSTDNNLNLESSCNVILTDDSRLLTYRSTRKMLGKDFCAPFSITYLVKDMEGLEKFLSQKQQRYFDWMTEQKLLTSQLILESERHDDVILLNVVDVYRNLPSKLISFLKWADRHTEYEFILKTDDDTFIDTKKVTQELLKLQDTKNLIWSSFREYWPVQSSGKWREDNYNSLTYPPFPCGSGYVLSADLVSYLVDNNEDLFKFQGEDTSVGIWLAPLSPFYKNDCWKCSDCNNFACNQPQLTEKEMYDAWVVYEKEGAILC